MKNLLAKVDGLSVREKLILLTVLLSVSLLILIEFMWTPGWRQQNALQADQQIAQTTHDSLLAQQDILVAGLREDSDATLKAENAKLARQVASKRQQLEKSLSRLVAPDDMPALLAGLLAAIPKLDIREVIKLPTRKLLQGEGEDDAVLYSHRVRITLTGSYFDALRYIRQIESKPSRLRLVSMDYTVEDYPLAQMVLEIETLGLDVRWLGV